MAQLAVPGAQAGLGGIGDAGDIGRAGERITRTIIHAVKVGTEQLIIVVVGIGVDQVILPDLDIGRVNTEDQHAGAGQVLVPLDALAVLDQEELILVGGVQAVTHIALFKGRQLDGPLSIDERGLRKAQGIAFIQAVASRVAAVVVLEAARHDGPGQRVGMVHATTAVTVGIIEVGQAQAMAELMADGTDTGNIVVNNIVLILFTNHVGRAGIELEVHTIEHGRVSEILHVGPQVIPVVGAVVRTVAGHQEEHHVGCAVLIGVILAEIHFGVKCLESGKEDRVAVELMSIGAGEGDIHRTQDVEVRVKLLERVVVIVVTHTAHAFDLGTSGKREALVVMAVDHLLIEILGRIV